MVLGSLGSPRVVLHRLEAPGAGEPSRHEVVEGSLQRAADGGIDDPPRRGGARAGV
jgi:hypothetical protein